MRLAGIVFSLVLLAAGALLGIVYPKAMEKALGREIGSWPVYSGGDGLAVPEPTLSPSDGAMVLTVDLYASGPLRAGEGRQVLLLDVLDGAGGTVLATALDFPDPGILQSPQTRVMRFQSRPVALPAASGPHRFVIAKGKDFTDQVLTVVLTLNGASYAVQPEARPVGIALMAAGGLGLAFSLRRRRQNPNSSPPPPKWGRR